MDERQQVTDELLKQMREKFRKEVDTLVEVGNASRAASDVMFKELEKLDGKIDVESRIRALELTIVGVMMESISATSQIMKSFDATMDRLDSISERVAKLDDRLAYTSSTDKDTKNEIKLIKSELDSTKQKVVDTLVPIKEGYDRLKELNNRKTDYIG